MKSLEFNKCLRHEQSGTGGVAVITFSDHGRASSFGEVLCNELDVSKLNRVCRFDMSALEQHLGDCLCGHSAALIIDSTDNGTKAGTVSLLDLGLLKEKCNQMQIPSTHGAEISSELKRINELGGFPDRVILLGVESPYANAKTGESKTTINNIAVIISTLLETLNRKCFVA